MYKNTKPLPDSFKIKVNPEQSKVLQEHLFSIGKYWISGDKIVLAIESRYLFFAKSITHSPKKRTFVDSDKLRIRFKDYFTKVAEQFPEKWCIEITQDNCEELNVYLHRNWKDYEDYKDTWEVTFDNQSDLFFSSSKIGWNKGAKDVFYELITTEQFRKQFGILTETKLQGTKAGNKELEVCRNKIEAYEKIINDQKNKIKDLTEKVSSYFLENKYLEIKLQSIKDVLD